MLPLVYSLRKDDGLRTIGTSAEYDAMYANKNISMFLDKIPNGRSVFDEAVNQAGCHIYSAALDRSEKQFFVDKSVRYYYIVEDLIRIFPHAKFVVLHRNPIAQFVADLKYWGKDGGDWRLFRKRYNHVVRSQFYIANVLRNYSDRIVAAKYEDVATQPEAVLRRICDYVGLEYEPQMPNYGNRINGVPEMDVVGMGDATTLYKHNAPVDTYVDNWPNFIRSAQDLYFARSCMQDLGTSVFDDLGYSYQTAWAKLSSMTDKNGEISVDWRLISHIEPDPDLVELHEADNGEESLSAAIPSDSTAPKPAETGSVISEWLCKHGTLAGVKYVFNSDGTFELSYPAINVGVKGKYTIDETQSPSIITLEHTDLFLEGLEMKGLYDVDVHLLKHGEFAVSNGVLKIRFIFDDGSGGKFISNFHYLYNKIHDPVRPGLSF